MVGEFFKSMAEKVQGANVKKEAITAVVIALILAIVSIVSTYFGIIKSVNTRYKSLDDYNEDAYVELTRAEFKEAKKDYKDELMDRAEFGKDFFKTLVVVVVITVVLSAILMLVGKFTKTGVGFFDMIALANVMMAIYAIITIINTVIALVI